MIASQKMRIAIIGLGDIAQKAYLPIVTNHAKVEPILCTRNTKTLKRLAIQYRINETYSDVDELIRNNVDAAMIHSSTDSHFLLVSKLLNAEIPVFVAIAPANILINHFLVLKTPEYFQQHLFR